MNRQLWTTMALGLLLCGSIVTHAEEWQDLSASATIEFPMTRGNGGTNIDLVASVNREFLLRDKPAALSEKDQPKFAFKTLGPKRGINQYWGDPFIVMTLAEPSIIHKVVIQNRQDANAAWAKNLTVWLSDDRATWKRAWSAREPAAEWAIEWPKGERARYVRIGLDLGETLSLNKVRIYGLADTTHFGKAVPAKASQATLPVEREDMSGIDFDWYAFPHYTGSVFPEAQHAVYANVFIPMKDVAIVLGTGIAREDMRVVLLQKKLAAWGVKADVADKVSNRQTQILLNVEGYGAPAPDKAEGYSIRCVSQKKRHLIAVNGKDRRGLLWGMVSALQLTKRDATGVAMRAAEIDDYPQAPVRAFLGSMWPRVYEFLIFTKMNSVVMHESAHTGGWDDWRTPGPLRLHWQRLADLAPDLGLDFYASLHPAASEPKFRASSEDDFSQIRHVIETCWAEPGLHLYWGYDDIRFPTPPEDTAAFGSAAEADAYAIDHLYKKIHARYPDFKMVYCPPFYSTSGINREEGGESGRVYSETIGKKIDPAVNFFWTGPLVVSHQFPKESVEEVTGLFQRKPWIFANRPGIHMGNWPFATDAYAWDKRSYDGFLDDTGAYAMNTWGAIMSTMIAQAGDYMWNPGAYDAVRSASNVVGLLLSPELFPVLEKMDRQLVLFDPYGTRNRGLQASATSAMNVAALEMAMRRVDDLYAQAMSVNSNGMESLTPYDKLVGMARALVQASKNPKLLADLPAERVKEIALQETGFNSVKDPFFSATGLDGGWIVGFATNGGTVAVAAPPGRKITFPVSDRPAKLIYGSQTGFSDLQASFVADPFPPSDDFELTISGRCFSNDLDCRLMVKVNDEVLFDGPSGFSKTAWSLKTIIIPFRLIKRHNTLRITNGDDSNWVEKPCLGISYVVVKEP